MAIMTQQRARYLWNNHRLPFDEWRTASPEHPDAFTEADREAVKELWRTMRGYTCWMDAFCRIYNGEANDA